MIMAAIYSPFALPLLLIFIGFVVQVQSVVV